MKKFYEIINNHVLTIVGVNVGIAITTCLVRFGVDNWLEATLVVSSVISLMTVIIVIHKGEKA